MARMTFKAGDEYALKLSRLATGADEITKKAIYVGAGMLTDSIRGSLQKVLDGSDTSTGDLEESLGITPIGLDTSGNWNTKVGFDGYDRKGVPNQLKARVLESGSSRATAKPFVRPAVRRVKKQTVSAMDKVIEEEIRKRMK